MTERAPPARMRYLRDAWSERMVAALPPEPVRSRAERRLSAAPAGVFHHVARIDRSLRKVHLQRLCQWFVAGAFRIEDARGVRDVLLRFAEAKARLPVADRDLNRFASPGDLEEALDKADGVVAADPLGAEALPDEVLAQCAVVASSSTWHVLRLDGPAAATHFADGTRWCTRHPGTFAGYRSRGPVYLLRHHRRRLQMHGPSGQLMDERDRPVDAKELSLFPTAARQALVHAILDEVDAEPSERAYHRHPEADLVAILAGIRSRQGGIDGGRPRHGSVAFRRGDGSRAYLYWDVGNPASGRGMAYALVTREGALAGPSWKPDAALLADAFRDAEIPWGIVLDQGPELSEWASTLDDPGKVVEIIESCGSATPEFLHEGAALARISENGLMRRAFLERTVVLLGRCSGPPEAKDPSFAAALAAAIPGADDREWTQVADIVPWEVPSLAALLKTPCPDRRLAAAIVAYARMPRIAGALASYVQGPRHEREGGVPEFVAAVARAGHPGGNDVILSLFGNAGAARRAFDDVAGMARGMDPHGGEAWRPALARLGDALGTAFGRLPGEGPEAVAARAWLTSPGASVPEGRLRDILLDVSHPDLRTACLALAHDPGDRLYRRRPEAEVGSGIVEALLSVPNTGHFVAALPPDRRAPLARRAVELGRAGVVACLPREMATAELYATLMGSPEFTSLLDIGSITRDHVEAVGATGLRVDYRLRLEEAVHASGEGPGWIVRAVAARERAPTPPVACLDAPAFARYAAMAGDLRVAVAKCVASGALPATRIREFLAEAVRTEPWLALGIPECEPMIQVVRPDQALSHPGLIARLDPDAVQVGAAIRFAAYLPREALAGLGRDLPSPPAAPWSGILARAAADPSLTSDQARLLLSAFPLDPACERDRSTAAALVARGGPVRPRAVDGRPWPAAASIPGLARWLAAAWRGGTAAASALP